MAIPEMNGVGAVRGNESKYELKPPKEQKMGNLPVGQGYGETNDVRPKFGVVNDYGGDIANFAKFKGNDKNDAMRLTNSAANDVKKQYMQLQHEYPGIELQFEPMPNPQTAGKKREGFFNYQQQLDIWKDNAMTQINNARERNTVEVVGDAVEAVNQNTNEKAATNAALTAGYGEANLEATEEEGVKTRKAVHSEGAATRRTVRNEGQKTREAVHTESAITRNTVRAEGAKTRNVVRQEAADTRNVVRKEGTKTRDVVRQAGQETQEINELSNEVSDVLNTEYHTGATKKQVGDMRDKIVSSNLPHESKKEMLKDLADFSDQVVISDKEITNEQKDVDMRIAIEKDTQEPETPIFEAPPLKEEPIFEPPFHNGGGKSVPKEPPKDKSIRKNPFIHDNKPKTDGVGVPYAPEPSQILKPKFKKELK